MPRPVVRAVIEEPAFQRAVARLVRLGPLMEVLLTERLRQIKAELAQSGGTPDGFYPHPDLDGSYFVERHGLRVRYYVMPIRQRGWLERLRRRLTSAPNTVDVRV
jgi:hypothetical protein